MIPRTKANFSLYDLIRSLFINHKARKHREHLVNQLNKITGEQNVLLMPSGRGALYFLLKALPHKRVIIPAYTCSAVAEAALLADKKVAYVDVAENSFNMNAELLGSVITKNSVVIVTHQFGIPCDIEALCTQIENAGAYSIEDMAGALGGFYDGRRLGSFCDASFYSFDTTKLINVPMKAGFLTLKNGIIAEKVRTLCNKELHQMPFSKVSMNAIKAFILVAIENAYIYRMFHFFAFKMQGKFTAETGIPKSEPDEFYRFEVSEQQAYIASRQISKYDALIDNRRKIWGKYHNALSGAKTFLVPDIGKRDPNEWACIRFPIIVQGDRLKFYRRAAHLGVDFAFSFSHLSCDRGEKGAWEIADHILDLPFYNKLSDKELQRVITVLKKIDEECFHEIFPDAENADESRNHL